MPAPTSPEEARQRARDILADPKYRTPPPGKEPAPHGTPDPDGVKPDPKAS